MHALIPRPARPRKVTGPTRHGPADTWRIDCTTPAFRPVAQTLRDLLAPHLALVPSTEEVSAPALATRADGSAHGPSSASAARGPVLRLTSEGAPAIPRRPVGVAPTGEAEPPDESYGLSTDDTGIVCRARTPAGAFRAAVTAAQLLLTAPPGGRLPRLHVEDGPHFAWRGLMLDPARTFLDVEEVCRLIDLAALYKLNVVHLHLTDNEGWRLQLPSLPALTARLPDGRRDFYTVEDYRALQAHAARRHITLVPEVDLPGHCAALRRALPGLPDAPAPEGLAGRFPFTPPLDLRDPGSREVVSAVLRDVCALTDGPFVHIGGDEALGITPAGFTDAVTELRALGRRFGKRPVAWQEASRAGVGAGDVLQFWVDVPMMDLPDTQEELDGRPDLADGPSLEVCRALKRFFAPADHDLARIVDGGGRVLLSPQSHLYLDRPYAAEAVPEDAASRLGPLGFPTYRPRGTEHAASWDPALHGVPEDRIAGVEATLFAERMSGFDDVVTLLLPRLAGVAETAWSGGPSAWEEYRRRLARHARWWRERGMPYAPLTDVPWEDGA